MTADSPDRDVIGRPTVRFVTGRPWKEAVIRLLEPRSPYRPWTTEERAEPGDVVVVTLDTDPVSIVTGVGTVGPDGDVDSAIAGVDAFYRGALFEKSTLETLTLGNDLVSVLGDYHRQDCSAMFGHTSMAAARVLLNSGGRCTACTATLPLTGPNAGDEVHVHTANPRQSDADWPAALCIRCHGEIHAQGFTDLLDFLFANRPRCPECHLQRALTPLYGMPSGPVEEPWIAIMGCVVIEPRAEWVCGNCGHEWRSADEPRR